MSKNYWATKLGLLVERAGADLPDGGFLTLGRGSRIASATPEELTNAGFEVSSLKSFENDLDAIKYAGRIVEAQMRQRAVINNIQDDTVALLEQRNSGHKAGIEIDNLIERAEDFIVGKGQEHADDLLAELELALA